VSLPERTNERMAAGGDGHRKGIAGPMPAPPPGEQEGGVLVPAVPRDEHPRHAAAGEGVNLRRDVGWGWAGWEGSATIACDQ